MKRREYRGFDRVNSLPVRLEELLSGDLEKLRDSSVEDIRKIVYELRKPKTELIAEKDIMSQPKVDTNHAIHELILDMERTDKALIDELLKHKTTTEVLNESQEFSRNLLENASHPVVVIDSDNSIKYVNAAFEKLTGFCLSDILGRKPPFPYWPEDKQQQNYTSYINEIASHTERLFRKKNGEPFWVELNFTPIEENGRMYSVV